MEDMKQLARVTGVFYLVIFFANVFVYFLVGPALIAEGDAAATATNLIASEGLFRAGIASYLLVYLSDIGVAVLLYILFRNTNQGVALLALVTRLIQTAVHGVNLLNYIFPLLLLSGAGYLTVFDPAQINSLVLLFLDAHHVGVLISEAFFAVALFSLGYLLVKSELFPSILGYLMAAAGAGYVLDSFGIFLLPQYAELFANIMVGPAIIGEMAFTLWLLIKGVKSPPGDHQAQMAAQPAK